MTSNQLICMQPSDNQRQIADRVRNQVRSTGNREMSSPSFGAADAPALIKNLNLNASINVQIYKLI